MDVPSETRHAPWSAGLERLALASRPWWARLATLAVTGAALAMLLFNDGPWHEVARLALTALLLLNAAAGLGEVILGLRRVTWERLGRFAWLQHAALAGGVLLVLVATYPLLVFLYPDLRQTPMTDVVVAMLWALLGLALAALALVAALIAFLLLALPVLLARTLLRRCQRRASASPGA